MASAYIWRRRGALGRRGRAGYCKGVSEPARGRALDGGGPTDGPVAVEAGLQRDERETLTHLGVIRGQELLPEPFAARERAADDARRGRERVQAAERQRAQL